VRLKRALDVGGSLVLLALAALPLGAAALLVLVAMGRPILFRQVRAGRDGRPFILVKLRTMRPGADGESDAGRLTAVGRWLRALSLDELPQLWNVLRGEMSLVGPRPLLPSYLGRYSPVQARRHEVLPGITGLAQVSGRNALDWDAKLALDVRYVDERSLGLDCWILWRTVATVMRSDGVSAPGHATMPEFVGAERREGSCVT
jgi:lipopolysaccharide/colanic/teichoic acid biosynthesis glycosyltransferase